MENRWVKKRLCNFKFSQQTLERLDEIVCHFNGDLATAFPFGGQNRSSVIRQLIDNEFQKIVSQKALEQKRSAEKTTRTLNTKGKDNVQRTKKKTSRNLGKSSKSN